MLLAPNNPLAQSTSAQSTHSTTRSNSPAVPAPVPVQVTSPAHTYLHGQAATTSGFYHSETGVLTYLAQYDKNGGSGCHVFMRQGRDLVGRSTPDNVVYRGKDYTKMLDKRKNPFSDERVFKGLDGRNYTWETERDHGDLIMRDEKTKQVVLFYDSYNSATHPDRLTLSTTVAEWRDLLILVVLQRRFKFAQERADAAAAAAEAIEGDLRQW